MVVLPDRGGNQLVATAEAGGKLPVGCPAWHDRAARGVPGSAGRCRQRDPLRPLSAEGSPYFLDAIQAKGLFAGLNSEAAAVHKPGHFAICGLAFTAAGRFRHPASH